ncbi:ATP11 protein-domain-containing protein [Cantharellus anzutake]|uniref:ATP11 protein-domain-containing protein n=1 Tax=Cantharellus anzutake TaxID=1750568 RepID=UPI001907D5B1|nr:ATP11 protein-domain-containing protein [Cantharellus anzutake]KAF8329099.1 ATP11 protein-domain-containing protein [Cantharellus anzutake]
MNFRRSRIAHWVTRPTASCRCNSSLPPGVALKYAEKLKARMESEGVNNLSELKTKLGPKPVEFVGELAGKKSESATPSASYSQLREKVRSNLGRKDSSPIKASPLSTLLNIPKLLQTPHTLEQVSALWNFYHASRSEGTGIGFLSASVPLGKYEAIIERARKYPTFLLPLARRTTNTGEDATGGEQEFGTEFFFLEWGFHPPPPPPSSIDPVEALMNSPDSDSPPASLPMRLPPITTVLFTTLQEYKLHGSFAQPRLVLTHYPDLSHTHGTVLLRGEITKSPSGGYLLSQMDAQLLAMGLQRFYLPAEGAAGQEAFSLLKLFHEDPSKFNYEQLMKYEDVGLGS